MTFQETILNAAFMLLWLKIWSRDGKETFFNPYLAPLDRASSALIRALRPVFFRASEQTIAAVSLVCLLIFRGFALHAASHSQPPWTIQFGFLGGTAAARGFVAYIAMSFISFAIFLFKIWALALLYVFARSETSTDRTSGTLKYLAKPFSSWRVEWRFPILLLTGISLSGALDVFGWVGSGMRHASLVPFYAICTLAEWANILNFAATLLMVFIVGSWIALFARSSFLMFTCKEWTGFLLGPLNRYPLRMGSLDLTPLVFFFVVHNLLHPFLISLLSSIHQRLL